MPRFRPDQIGPYALVAFIVALVLGWRLFRRPPRLFGMVVLAAVLLVPAVAVARGFGRIDMVSIIFHADFGMEGATLAGLEDEIIQGTLSGFFLVVTLGLLIGLWSLGPRSILLACVAVVAVNPAIRSMGMVLATPSVTSDLNDRFAPPSLNSAAAANPDVLVIYLEGVDRQFADPAVWGDLYAPLASLAAEGLSFSRVGQIEGTGWSMAGMLATQCGVPVVTKGLSYRNNFEGIEAFMPKVTCLGDVLQDRGYSNTYVVGGDAAFGGIDALYRTHGDFRQIDMQTMTELYPADEIKAAKGGWVLDDQMVFQTAEAVLAEEIAQDRPFLFVVETIGPHGRKGILSRRCNDGKTVTLSRDVRAVVGCLLENTVQFVRAAQEMHAKMRAGKDLRIVVLSDHLSHNPTLPDVAAEFDGFNTAIFLGGPGPSGQVIDKAGAMIDIYPSMLDWLGLSAPPHAAALGRSLLRADPTIVEVHGIAMFDRMLVSDAALAQRIWAD